MGLRLVIGNKNYSSWSLRPWLAMRVAGLAFEEQVVSLSDPNFKKTVTQISPAGQVPALEDGDVCVWETPAILEYLNEKFLPPSYGRRIGPPAPRLGRSRPRCMLGLLRCGANAR
jgi:glutathione S-transferase